MLKGTLATLIYSIYPQPGLWVEAWFSSSAGVTIGKMKKLYKKLPGDPDVKIRPGMLGFNIDTSRAQYDKISMAQFVRKIQTAIQQSLGVKAGLCPVTTSSSARVLSLV